MATAGTLPANFFLPLDALTNPDLTALSNCTWLVSYHRRRSLISGSQKTGSGCSTKKAGTILDDNEYPIFTASRVKTYTIEDIIAEHGARVPDFSESQKDFRAAAILLVDEEHPATRGILERLSDDISWFSHPGDDVADQYNFYEATGGRGTIAMDGLPKFQKSNNQ